jgi:hypothetical protein
MTIREYIVRRVNLSRSVVVLWMIAILTSAALRPSFWHGAGARGGFWFLASITGMFAVILLIHSRTRCPRCGTRFHRETLFAQRSKFWRTTYDHCSHCGVSIDEPMERPVNQP